METFSVLLDLYEGNRLILLTKASDTELWNFLWYAPEQTVEQTIETLVISDAIALIMTSLQCVYKSWSSIAAATAYTVKTL